MYLTVVAIGALASLLVMALNVNATPFQANAFDIDNPDNKVDIGKSQECVKVVVGCGGQGTVGDNNQHQRLEQQQQQQQQCSC